MSVPGGTYMVTRTTVMSLFLLVPGKVVNEIMEYCMAWAAQGRGILLHAISVESNHYHLVLTDTQGKLSEFMQEFNRCVARCLIAYYRTKYPNRRLDAVWSAAQSFCDTLLVNSGAILGELVYTFINPVKDGLVRDYRKWPGFNTRPSDWRKGTRSVKRPDFYFKNTPEVLTYEIVPPKQLAGDVEQQIAEVEHHIQDSQKQAAVDLAAQGRSFVGTKAVIKCSPFDAPSTPRPRGNLAPRLAAAGDKRALSAAATALKLFRIAYREAWVAFKDGVAAVFPGGTLMMRRRYRVQCEPLDACWCHLAPTWLSRHC